MPALGSRSLQRFPVYISTLLLGLGLIYWLLGSTMEQNKTTTAKERAYHYETVTGYFMQDDPKTDPDAFDYSKHDFGLIKRAYDDEPSQPSTDTTQWQRFAHHLSHLRASAPKDVTYKLLLLGRHGQGDHNVAESYYGTKAWDDYWSKLEGNGTVIWSDAHLTELGTHQARDASVFYKHLFEVQKMPMPESFYVSPLYRCLQTADFTFTGVVDNFRPLIKEKLREVMGEHTCDRRSTRTIIHSAFPHWPIEAGFAEEDELWQAEHRETFAEHDVRTLELLDDIYEHDGHAVVSLTSHSGQIASMLRVLGHREFRLPTGALIPVFVKARKVR